MAPFDKNQSAKHDSRTSLATHMHEALTLERLNGTNYVEWSLNAQNKIRGRERFTSLEQRLHQKTINLMNMKHGKMKTA